MQIQQNERERLETARPDAKEGRDTPSPVIAEPTDSSYGVSCQEPSNSH